jgi:hypothetical protein
MSIANDWLKHDSRVCTFRVDTFLLFTTLHISPLFFFLTGLFGYPKESVLALKEAFFGVMDDLYGVQVLFDLVQEPK